MKIKCTPSLICAANRGQKLIGEHLVKNVIAGELP